MQTPLQTLQIRQFSVDIQRGRVADGDRVTSLEPKVLQVLLHLARHQGEVVSHQALMDAVWGRSIVDPSTLQRCIGQLRRAFGDDARQQHTIATYPKNGYSLLPEVSWTRNSPQESPPAESAHSRHPAIIPAFAATGLAVVLALGMLFWWSPDELRLPDSPADSAPASMPALEGSGFHAVYSPDGRYVAYSRAGTSPRRQLLGRNLANGIVFPLTPANGHYQDLAWSPEGRQIAFIAQCQTADCEPDTNICSSLQAVNLQEALAGNPSPRILLACGDRNLRSPQWTDRQQIALIEEGQDSTAVIELDLENDGQRTLFSRPGLQPRQLSWSAGSRRLAVLLQEKTGAQSILLISDLEGESPLHDRIPLPETMRDEQLRIAWSPGANGLLVSTATDLYQVELDGTITRQAPPFLPDTHFPSQH